MLAAVLQGLNRLALEQVPVPRPTGPETVLVRVRSCGICATDVKAIKGHRTNVVFPFIPGHEASGVVAEVGPAVEHFKVGDEVICQPSGYCGFCEWCRTGRSHYCERAFTTGGDGPMEVWPGAFAEYMLTREQCLFHKPSAVSFDSAALTEPLSGAWKGVIGTSQMQLGETVVVIGAGSMGLLCVMVAAAAGAGRLVAFDPSPYARKRAVELGATSAHDPRAGDPRKAVWEAMPEGPDLVIEAAGTIEAVNLMLRLRRRGTRWNLFGITTHETFVMDGGLTHFMEGRMDASFGTTPLAMTKAIRLMELGLVNPESIITHRFPLSRIHDALAAMNNPDRIKIMINP